jgi:hypothetical protein
VAGLLLLIPIAGLGCFGDVNVFCNDPVDRPYVRCDAQGNATVAASSGFAIAPTAAVTTGSSCLATDGTCSSQPTFLVHSSSDAVTSTGHGVTVGVYLDPTTVPGRYTLPAAGSLPSTSGSLRRTDDVVGLQVLSGTVVVTRADLDGLDAEFTLELVADDGAQHISISAGHAVISGCKVVMEPTCPSSGP